MARMTKETVFKSQPPRAETAMDKTTRVVREMIDDEAEKRQTKMARLRKARLEREAHTPAPAAKAPPKTRKKAVAKTPAKTPANATAKS